MVKKNRFWLIFIAAVIVIIDGITKYLVDTHMRLHESIELPVSFVQLTYIRNFGAAFGVLQHQSVLFICIAVFTVGLILYFFEEIKESGSLAFTVAALMLGGAIGNLIDRVRFGYVIDFIDLKVWP
ncbi:signal peptidase II, partial [bacterium]|nr:signal peptidase II [bacterium]